MLVKVLGLHLGVGRWFGNCFHPALTLEWKGVRRYGSWFVITFRSRGFVETKVYGGIPVGPLMVRETGTGKLIRNPDPREPWMPRLWWNSEHLARRYGKASEAWNGDTVYQWRSRWFGNHIEV